MTSLTSEGIPLAFLAKPLTAGVKVYEYWQPSRNPHLLLIGATGTGKSYAISRILSLVSERIPHAGGTFCDFKGDDSFAFLSGCKAAHRHTDCERGFDSFFEMFLRRQTGDDPSRDFRVLCFDEWASFVTFLGPKASPAVIGKLALLLMLGRSFNVHVIVGQQRADAQYFSTARDNFSIILALGNLSKESAAMFGFDRDLLEPAFRLGAGNVLINGAGQKAVQVPAIRDMRAAQANIRRLFA